MTSADRTTVPLHTPALGMSADSGLPPAPNTQLPNPNGKSTWSLNYSKAGVDSGEIIIRGGSHLDFSFIPNQAFGASLRGPDMIDWYTTAWFDKYLKRSPDADRELLTTRWPHDPTEASVDPNHDGNAFSFYYYSRLDFNLANGQKVDCEDLRDGCSALGAGAGHPGDVLVRGDRHLPRRGHRTGLAAPKLERPDRLYRFVVDPGPPVPRPAPGARAPRHAVGMGLRAEVIARKLLPALVAAAAATTVLATPASAAALRTGCDRSHPAIAYRAGGGRPLRPQPSRAPIPCLAVIDQRSSESADVGVLRSGRILYAPLVENSYQAPLDDRGPAEIAASDDGGASWRTMLPGDANHALEVPPWMSVDPQTQRIWFATALPDLCGAEISWSDDAGRTWQTNTAVGCPAMGSESVLEGPAPAGGARSSGYPHVVYYCANASDLSPSNLWCYRSLDGGTSFSFTGSFPDPPPKSGCNTEHAARPGAVGAEGYLYFPIFQCGDLSMAVSRDEGASWQLVHIGNEDVQDMYTTSVAVDRGGNVYLAWIESVPGQPSQPAGGGPNPATEAIDGAGIPMLSVSRDHGNHWSVPLSVGPPGVRNAETIAIAAHGPGRLAISYLANTNAGKLVDGWLSETSSALGPHPVWWAAPLNDPRTPLVDTSQSTSFGNRLFFNTDSFAPTGQPWAAFHCAFTAACPNQRIGVVGHLAPGPKPRARPRRHRLRPRRRHRR